jgi:flagellar biosynthesis/type III secretory pathway protein FliH
MIRKMLENHINSLFEDLQKISEKIAKSEIEKQNTNSVLKLTEQVLDKEVQAKILSISMQIQILVNIETGVKKC